LEEPVQRNSKARSL